MPQSLSCILIHGVFSTKSRQPYLNDPAIRSQVHAYLGGVSNRLECPVIAVGGPEDHVHVLSYLARTMSVSEWIKEIKRVSSSFAKEEIPGFAWQSGYGAFSVSRSDLDGVARYVRGQEGHHKEVSFQDEFRQLLAEHGIEFDERYVWDRHNPLGVGVPRSLDPGLADKSASTLG